MEQYGITYDDIRKWGGTVDFSAYDSVANSMKDNQIDVAVRCGPGEPIFLQEVALNQKLRWIPGDKPEVVEKMKEHGLFQTVVKGSEFNGMVGSDVPVMSDTNELFTSVDVPEDVVYEIVKSWMENHKAIGEANPG